MNAQRVRIVVGEGRSSQQGLLRFVLVGEGYDVVADATNPAELARVLAAHKPDVVVLDDGIGATAVGVRRARRSRCASAPTTSATEAAQRQPGAKPKPHPRGGGGGPPGAGGRGA